MKNEVYTGTVLVDMLNVYMGPGQSYEMIPDVTLKKGDEITFDDFVIIGKRFWFHHELGWSLGIYGSSKYIEYNSVSSPTTFAAKKRNTGGKKSNRSTKTKVKTSVATSKTYNNIFDTLITENTNNGQTLKRSMKLFGLPYQFIAATDPRVDKVSKTIGRSFINNIILPAPIVTIIPGKPRYLPASKDKVSWTHAMVAAGNGSLAELQQLVGNKKNKELRFYDFQSDYTSYMKYVNILCRTAASYLEITETVDGKKGGESYVSYDWRNYRWDANSYSGAASRSMTALAKTGKAARDTIVGKIKSFGAAASDAIDDVIGSSKKKRKSSTPKLSLNTSSSDEEEESIAEALLQTTNYIQFYCDPDFGLSESASNTTATSKLEGLMESGSDTMKELAFMVNSGGADMTGLTDLTTDMTNAIADTLTTGSGSIRGVLGRVVSLSDNILKGENLIIPEIYQSSARDNSFSIKVHLKTPYGNRYSYFKEILVPMFHLLALALPKQTTANTYGSPFLVKVCCDGLFTCNLGIVTGCTIEKNISPENWSNDGFPTEVDVTLQVQDLYNDLSMTPQNEPLMFLNNSSLLEYIATNCGISLIKPQIKTKLTSIVDTVVNSFEDIPDNVVSLADDALQHILEGWAGLKL